MIPVGHVDVFETHRLLSAARRLRDAEAEGLSRRLGALDFIHSLDLLELALRLRGLRGDGAEAVGKFLKRGDFLLLVFPGGKLLLVVGFALSEGF